ncbi:allantoate permease [Biscogniauxia marginata]|nr:allantoate permease [Biscogniauxia marginata]
MSIENKPPAGTQLGSVEPHAFSDPEEARYWQQLYEKAGYEGRHRFDPSFQWSAQGERLLRRKLDLRIMLWVWIMFSSLDLVRRNINRAVSDNLLDDLGVSTNDYNTGQTIYYVFFLAAELPGGLISKKVGPFRYTPAAIVLWGVLCAVQTCMRGRASFWTLRALLGVCQGGFVPEMVLYLSYFFKGNELPFRLSVFWTAIPLTQVYGSLLASGILLMRGLRGWAGWQWLFLFEGLICIIIGIISFFVMPASITEPALGFRRSDGSNKWWTEDEEKVLVNRLLRDDPSKGDINNRNGINVKGVIDAFTNVDLWPIYLLGLSAFIPFQPTANYLSLTLRNLGYSVFESNILTIPGYILYTINTLICGWLSEKLNERCLVAAISNIWMLPFFAGLIGISPDASPWVRYVLLTCINGIPYTHSILVGMASKNAKGVARRTCSAAAYNMSYQVGSIIAVNIYRDNDTPYYYTGNRALTGLCVANILFFILTKIYYIRRNKSIVKQYNDLPESEKLGVIDMRFAH